MKNTITIIILMITLTPCRGQLLQPRKCELELTIGSIKKATLFAYNDTALIIIHKRQTDSTYRLDTVPLRYIETIKVPKLGKMLKNTLIGTGTGLATGIATGAVLASMPSVTRDALLPPYFVAELIMLQTTCTGTLIGTIIGLGTTLFIPSTYTIGMDENNFKKFVKRFKNK